MRKRAHLRLWSPPSRSWARALTPETIAATIPAAHVDWLRDAPLGSLLARSDDDEGYIGHIYPEVGQVPHGWLPLASNGGAS